MANIFSLLTVQKMQVAAITMTYCYVDGWVLSTVADYLRQEKDTSLVIDDECKSGPVSNSVSYHCYYIIGLTLKCQLKEVPLLPHRPPTTTTPTTTITSQFFGGKFKHLNRRNSESLVGFKFEMQNAKCKM